MYKIELESKILCISVITGLNVIGISRINIMKFIEIKLSENIGFIWQQYRALCDAHFSNTKEIVLFIAK